MKSPKIHVAIPVMRESELLPKTLDCIAQQRDVGDFCVYLCVNQPDSWWHLPDRLPVCLDNQKTLESLKNEGRFPLVVLDCSTQGSGLIDKKSGVGYARKILIDNILTSAHPDDLIVSLDADTTFGERYFQSLRETFRNYPQHVAMAVPYYHPLTTNDAVNRTMLRYEIYMRFYALNLLRINSPYCFTALGSAIVVPVWAMKAVKGITPRTSGEDFYLLQKLRKFGQIILWNDQKVFPATRFSDRVAFGTGPAIAKRMNELQQSYPLYPPELFDQIKQTYQRFPTLWEKDVPTPMDAFLHRQLGDEIWQPLRKNFTTEKQFVRACHEKIDGLRILQFLKSSLAETNDSLSFTKNWNCFFDENPPEHDFENAPIDALQMLRNRLVNREEMMQKKYMESITKY